LICLVLNTWQEQFELKEHLKQSGISVMKKYDLTTCEINNGQIIFTMKRNILILFSNLALYLALQKCKSSEVSVEM